MWCVSVVNLLVMMVMASDGKSVVVCRPSVRESLAKCLSSVTAVCSDWMASDMLFEASRFWNV